MFCLSNSGCVDYTLNNIFASLDYLHSSKILIFLIFVFYKLVNVGYTFFSVISQDIVRSNMMSKIVRHDVQMKYNGSNVIFKITFL